MIWCKYFLLFYLLSLVNDFFAMQKKIVKHFYVIILSVFYSSWFWVIVSTPFLISRLEKNSPFPHLWYLYDFIVLHLDPSFIWSLFLCMVWRMDLILSFSKWLINCFNHLLKSQFLLQWFLDAPFIIHSTKVLSVLQSVFELSMLLHCFVCLLVG